MVGRFKLFPYSVFTSVKSLLLVPEKAYELTEQHKIAVQRFEQYVRKGDIVMLGDSLTAALNWHDMTNLDGIINRGIPGNTTFEIFDRIEQIHKVEPKTVFIMMGINDIIMFKEPAEIIRNYEQIVKNLIARDIDVVIQSTLLVRELAATRNPVVLELNELLQKLAKENDLVYVDLNKVLAPGGMLRPEYTFDGVHLTALGYEVWLSEIRDLLSVSSSTKN